MKELVTIQVGDFANYVGSHFWNFQDELLGLAGDPNADSFFKNHDLNMDVLYRTGVTQQSSNWSAAIYLPHYMAFLHTLLAYFQ
ncbi:hypothetical protein AAHE18_07G048800 [Arachis hypogaea]